MGATWRYSPTPLFGYLNAMDTAAKFSQGDTWVLPREHFLHPAFEGQETERHRKRSLMTNSSFFLQYRMYPGFMIRCLTMYVGKVVCEWYMYLLSEILHTWRCI